MINWLNVWMIKQLKWLAVLMVIFIPNFVFSTTFDLQEGNNLFQNAVTTYSEGGCARRFGNDGNWIVIKQTSSADLKMAILDSNGTILNDFAVIAPIYDTYKSGNTYKTYYCGISADLQTFIIAESKNYREIFVKYIKYPSNSNWSALYTDPLIPDLHSLTLTVSFASAYVTFTSELHFLTATHDNSGFLLGVAYVVNSPSGVHAGSEFWFVGNNANDSISGPYHSTTSFSSWNIPMPDSYLNNGNYMIVDYMTYSNLSPSPYLKCFNYNHQQTGTYKLPDYIYGFEAVKLKTMNVWLIKMVVTDLVTKVNLLDGNCNSLITNDFTVNDFVNDFSISNQGRLVEMDGYKNDATRSKVFNLQRGSPYLFGTILSIKYENSSYVISFDMTTRHLTSGGAGGSNHTSIDRTTDGSLPKSHFYLNPVSNANGYVPGDPISIANNIFLTFEDTSGSQFVGYGFKMIPDSTDSASQNPTMSSTSFVS